MGKSLYSDIMNNSETEARKIVASAYREDLEKEIIKMRRVFKKFEKERQRLGTAYNARLREIEKLEEEIDSLNFKLDVSENKRIYSGFKPTRILINKIAFTDCGNDYYSEGLEYIFALDWEERKINYGYFDDVIWLDWVDDDYISHTCTISSNYKVVDTEQ